MSNLQEICLLFLLIFVVKGDNGAEFDRCPSQSRHGGSLKVHGSRCYQFYPVEMYWHEGRQFCLNRGGDLITIHRQDIQEFVVKSLREIGWRRKGVWIGATDMHEEENWKWVSGQSVRSGYQNWDSGQPSCWMPLIKSLCKEDCACLRTDEGYKWHDYFCAAKHFEYGFICQYDMLPVPTRGPNVAANTLKISGNKGTTVRKTTITTKKVTSPKPVVVTLKDVKATNVDGDYAKSDPGSECHYGNKTYKSGDSFPDDCNTCRCYNGHVGCTKMACIRDMLPVPTRGPNVAANTLKISGNKGTTVRKTTITTKKVTSPKPVVVTLKDVKATNVDGDYAKSDPGSECHYGNKTYKSGDSFRDDCNTCRCYNGHVGCTKMSCIRDTVTCFYNNVWYNNGDKVKVTDDCQWCYCKNGEIKCSPSDCKNIDDKVGNQIGVHSQQGSSQEEGMKTGSVVGMVVAFILVFVAGIIIGIFLCKRRYKKRYEENASAGFSNVLYTAAPQQTEVKQTTLLMSDQESDIDEDPPHYTSIDNICVPPPYTEAAAAGISIYDDVADLKKVKPEEADEQAACEKDLTVDLPPTPCGMSASPEINLALPQQPADGISEAYSNNLYGVQ